MKCASVINIACHIFHSNGQCIKCCNQFGFLKVIGLFNIPCWYSISLLRHRLVIYAFLDLLRCRGILRIPNCLWRVLNRVCSYLFIKYLPRFNEAIVCLICKDNVQYICAYLIAYFKRFLYWNQKSVQNKRGQEKIKEK